MIRARSARLRRVVAVRTHAVSCARSCAATANLVATAMPCLHHAITGMASELTRRDTSHLAGRGAEAVLLACTELELLTRSGSLSVPALDTTKIHADAAWEVAVGRR